MERLIVKRASDGSIRTDQPQIEAELLCHWQGECVPAAGDENHFDSALLCPPKRIDVGFRDMELRVEQGAVDIDGEKANGKGHRKS